MCFRIIGTESKDAVLRSANDQQDLVIEYYIQFCCGLITAWRGFCLLMLEHSC